MEKFRCPECGCPISEETEYCPDCGISKKVIQELLEEKRMNEPSRKQYIDDSMKIICPACKHIQMKNGNYRCSSCKYPLLTLSSDEKKIKQSIKAYQYNSLMPPHQQSKNKKCVQKSSKVNTRPISFLIAGLSCIVVVCASLWFLNHNPTKNNGEKANSVENGQVNGTSQAITASSVPESVFAASSEFEDTSDTIPAEETADAHEVVATPEPTAIPEATNSPEPAKASADSYEIGDTYIFGSYEQNNRSEDGPEDIEWIILDGNEEGFLLISKYVLDGGYRFNEFQASVTWETCTIREWVNTEFLNTAFTEKEQKKIMVTTVKADANKRYDTDPGADTEDRIFFLSGEEAEHYFTDYRDLKGISTEAAKEWVQCYSSDSECKWWMRTPGASQEAVTCSGLGGYVDYAGEYAHMIGLGIRPALWVKHQ